MIVEFVFITSVSQFPQDVFERVKDNTLVIHNQVTWHFINEKEIVNLLWRLFLRNKNFSQLIIFQVCAAAALLSRGSPFVQQAVYQRS